MKENPTSTRCQAVALVFSREDKGGGGAKRHAVDKDMKNVAYKAKREEENFFPPFF
jgi:hypothetical protein